MLRAVVALLAVSLLAAAPPDDVREATQALEQQDYGRAAGILEKLLERDAENVSLLFNLAFAYTHTGREDQAIELYQKVVERQPDLLSARVNLGLLLLERERAVEALPHLEAAAQARPDDFPTQLFHARALAGSEKPEQAIVAYRKAAQLDSTSPEAALELGQTLEELGRVEEAVAAYRQAAKLDPQLDDNLLRMAAELEKGNRLDESLRLYQEYLAAHGDALAAREQTAFLLLRLERYPEAIEHLLKVREQDPTAASHAALAEAYSRNNEPQKALPPWKEAVAADPASAGLRLRYANALLYAEMPEQAAEQYLEAAKRNANLVEAWNGLAFSLYRMENYQGTVKALDEVAARAAEKPAAVFLRALAEDRLQMYEQAKASYERFLAMAPGMEDEEWKSRERIKTLVKILEKR